jgi:hypothetical protein
MHEPLHVARVFVIICTTIDYRTIHQPGYAYHSSRVVTYPSNRLNLIMWIFFEAFDMIFAL